MPGRTGFQTSRFREAQTHSAYCTPLSCGCHRLPLILPHSTKPSVDLKTLVTSGEGTRRSPSYTRSGVTEFLFSIGIAVQGTVSAHYSTAPWCVGEDYRDSLIGFGRHSKLNSEKNTRNFSSTGFEGGTSR